MKHTATLATYDDAAIAPQHHQTNNTNNTNTNNNNSNNNNNNNNSTNPSSSIQQQRHHLNSNHHHHHHHPHHNHHHQHHYTQQPQHHLPTSQLNTHLDVSTTDHHNHLHHHQAMVTNANWSNNIQDTRSNNNNNNSNSIMYLNNHASAHQNQLNQQAIQQQQLVNNQYRLNHHPPHFLHSPAPPTPPPPPPPPPPTQQPATPQPQTTAILATAPAVQYQPQQLPYTIPNKHTDSQQHQQQQPHQHGQTDFIEEVIQAILMAKEALEKPIEERDERDILLIDHLCSHFHSFDNFPKSVRRALAAQAVLIIIDETGKELIVHNEELDSFCVLIFGECEQLNVAKTFPIRTYQIGDSFGVCEPTTETVRFNGHMITKCENCAFLCVKRDDFYTILTDPANYPNKETIKHKDRNGHIVCVSQFNIEKKSTGPLWTNHNLQSTSNPLKIVLPDGHIIIKATEECLLTSLVDGYDRMDPEYGDDFLLLFRVFMTHDQREKERKLPPGMIKLCLALTKWLEQNCYRDRVVKIVLTWLSSYYHDFELEPEFSYLFFKVLESRLLNSMMNNQLHLLHVTLSTKSKVRHVTISRSSREQPLTFSISGGYEKNCGIFVTQVHGSNSDECPFDGLMNYLRYGPRPSVPPRLRVGTCQHANLYLQQEPRTSSILLRPGDQILEVNGVNFSAIKLVEAQKKLDMSTHLSLTVRYNPSAYYEMKALPEGRRKSSLSSVSSVSPYQPAGAQSKFTFNTQDQITNINSARQNDQYPPASPLFSNNANFGFRSIIKAGPKNDRSRLSSLINSSKQFVKQIRDSTVQTANNLETMSRTSDNTSDTQSNDIDIGGNKAKSNPELASAKIKDRLVESGLSNIVRLDDLKPDNAINGSNNGQMIVNVLRVFNAANNDSRYLLVHEETTAREVVMVAVKEFNLTGQISNQSPNDKSLSSLNWYLYEVSVVPESKTIKQKCLSEQTNKLAERASLSSRFYIKQASGGPTRLDNSDDALVNEILKESPCTVNITSLNATLLAVELTLADFDKFRSIEPQQFVYDTFFDYREKSHSSGNSVTSSADSASLGSSSSDGQDGDYLQTINKARSIPKSWMREYQDFADICNKEMFWVVCEILGERNIGRRVKIVKQFIRVADVCSQLRNYNSMFAIISGLGHNCVSRLKRTFEKLKPKYKNQLEKMRGLFDPSRNMSNYRDCLKKTPPPAIPLFPQIKKDLTFQKEGRSIFIREPHDGSDDEDYSQDTIKRRSRDNLLTTVKSTTILDQTQNGNNLNNATRSISYTGFSSNGNSNRHGNNTSGDYDNILVNFAEIRQFTERVRNVIYFSSIPYSNDLLTNTKDHQRNQAQIKKMHEECQMRKRIRHYINHNLTSAIVNDPRNSNEKLDQVDSGYKNSTSTTSSSSLPKSIFKTQSKLNITFDEKTLYQRSLEVEPELNVRQPAPPAPLLQPTQQNPISERQFPQQATQSVLYQPLNLTQVPPTNALSMHPPPLGTPLNPHGANNSPTLSKSSSLSSCSSFNHQLPTNYHGIRAASTMTSSVGKFGTESTESLRKLQALSENVDDWKPYHGNGNNHGSNNNTNTNCNINRVGANGEHSNRAKSIVTSRIFSGKGNR